MTSINIEKLNALASHLAIYDVTSADIWSICDKGFLFRLFKDDPSGSAYLIDFHKIVKSVIDGRETLNANVANLSPKGKWLLFDPSSTMYDGVAGEISSGFYDSDDLPPPEFWVSIENDLLVSFIPDRFLDIASLGVDSNISGSLAWLKE